MKKCELLAVNFKIVSWYSVHLVLALYYNILIDSLHYAKSSLTWVLSRSFLVPCVQLSMLGGLPGPSSIGNGAYGTEKLLLNTQVSVDFV